MALLYFSWCISTLCVFISVVLNSSVHTINVVSNSNFCRSNYESTEVELPSWCVFCHPFDEQTLGPHNFVYWTLLSFLGSGQHPPPSGYGYPPSGYPPASYPAPGSSAAGPRPSWPPHSGYMGGPPQGGPPPTTSSDAYGRPGWSQPPASYSPRPPYPAPQSGPPTTASGPTTQTQPYAGQPPYQDPYQVSTAKTWPSWY